jgi:hypothetical protein
MTAMTENNFIMNSTGPRALHPKRQNGTVISARGGSALSRDVPKVRHFTGRRG